jgi:hypothetical protein
MIAIDPPLQFPFKLSLRGPSSTELSERFEAVRAWIAALQSGQHYRIEFRDVRHRILGSNAVPSAVWIETLEAALALIGKSRDAKRFEALIAQTREQQPALLAWLARQPLKALALNAEWSRLLAIVEWLRLHPRPGIYLRQIDIPAVHSKFIEAHRLVLSELLDLCLPEASIDRSANGSAQFCRRYGLRDKPLRVRFRLLDTEQAWFGPGAEQDYTINDSRFADLDCPVQRVFITENEINYLAFPTLPRSLVIFGAGYGFANLATAAWLRNCEVFYWGDIDTHGFAILDQLRSLLPETRSLLMDRSTLLAHEALWGTEPQALNRDLVRLTQSEGELYDDLRDNRLGDKLRLEQERIAYGWLMTALQALDFNAVERGS